MTTLHEHISTPLHAPSAAQAATRVLRVEARLRSRCRRRRGGHSLHASDAGALLVSKRRRGDAANEGAWTQRGRVRHSSRLFASGLATMLGTGSCARAGERRRSGALSAACVRQRGCCRSAAQARLCACARARLQDETVLLLQPRHRGASGHGAAWRAAPRQQPEALAPPLDGARRARRARPRAAPRPKRGVESAPAAQRTRARHRRRRERAALVAGCALRAPERRRPVRPCAFFLHAGERVRPLARAMADVLPQVRGTCTPDCRAARARGACTPRALRPPSRALRPLR